MNASILTSWRRRSRRIAAAAVRQLVAHIPAGPQLVGTVLGGFERKVLRIPAERRGFLFVAAMPKSGSTFLSHKAAEYLGWRWSHLSDLPGGCDVDLYRPSLIGLCDRPLVCQQHTLGTAGNIDYLRRYGAKIVVTTRPLSQVILSFRDHLISTGDRWVSFDTPADFGLWPLERQTELLVDLLGPWLVHFLVSWRTTAAENPDLPIRVITHADLLADERAAFSGLLRHLGVEPDAKRVGKVLGTRRGSYRDDASRAARRTGLDLPASQRARLERLTSYYPPTLIGANDV